MTAVSFPAAIAQCAAVRSSSSSSARSLALFRSRPSSHSRRLQDSNSASTRIAVHCSSTSGISRNKLFSFSSAPTTFRTFHSGFGSSFSWRESPIRFVAPEAVGNGATGAPDPPLEEKPPRIYTWPYKKNPRVCVLGGGFGGLYTALRLESLVWPDDKKPQVLLVDQAERFVFKPMLYEILTGARLVLALGSEAKLDVVPGSAEFALPFSTLEDALKVDHKLKELERRTFAKESPISVCIVGCGYAGVELAATVSERLGDKGVVRAINVENMICPTAPPGNREAALKVLSSRKVELLLGYFVRSIQRAISEKYILELQPAERGMQSQILETDLVLWTVGSKPLLPELEPNEHPQDLPLNARGQAETDETLRVKGHPRIFALGDSSALRDLKGNLLPPTAQVAFQQADFTGWNLWAAINDRPLLPFRFQNLGEMMTLGQNDAAVSPSFIDGLTLEGPVGHAARKIAYLIRLPTDEHRVKVGVSWLTKSAIQSIASVQSTIASMVSGS
ncbi:Alternative NAD(P)H-ubiquinone oxidoreductase C1, chloroplastic/mitochondrial [Linum perenne]